MLIRKSVLTLCLISLVKSETLASDNDKSSLVFVIDDTYSMIDDIEMVIEETNRMFETVLQANDSVIDNFILVTFNDPAISYKDNDVHLGDTWPDCCAKLIVDTKKRMEFKNALQSISVSGGQDCPEYSLGGIKLALDRALPRSYVYVFTDAGSKDYQNYKKVKYLALKKQAQINFIYTVSKKFSHCHDTNSDKYKVYEKLASVTSGQLFTLTKENVGKLIAQLSDVIKSRPALILEKYLPSGYNEFNYESDRHMHRETIIATGSKYVYVNVKNPDGEKPKVTIPLQTDRITVVYVQSNPGNRTVIVSSRGESNVKVIVDSVIQFNYGFSTFKPSKFGDVTSIPVPDQRSYISILLTRGDVQLKTVTLLDMNGHNIRTIPVKRYGIDDIFYVTEAEIIPGKSFRIAINCYDPASKTIIRRINNSPIAPIRATDIEVVKDIRPKVRIEGAPTLSKEYNKTLQLKCIFTGHPKPDVKWIDLNKNSVISSDIFVKEDSFEYVSIINVISNMETDSIFKCEASNKLGSDSSEVVVLATKPFIRILVNDQDVVIKYSQNGQLFCKFESYPEAEIIWYKNGEKISEYHLETSTTKQILMINKMDIYDVGQYKCEIRNRYLKQDINFNVTISGVAKPDITSFDWEIKDNVLKAKCRAEGTPKPIINWYFLPKDGDRSVTIPSMIDNDMSILILRKLTKANAGEYKCSAANNIGITQRSLEIQEKDILIAPTVVIDGEKPFKVNYNTNITLFCKVNANPEPEVFWQSSDGLIYHTTVSKTPFDWTSKLSLKYLKRDVTYTCKATNEMGSDYKTVAVNIIPPLQTSSETPVKIVAEYGKPMTLKCDVFANTSLPITVEWIKEPNKVLSLNKAIKDLTIPYMDIDSQGAYTCKVKVDSDPDIKVQHTVEVAIKDLAPAKITLTSDTKERTLTVKCRTSGNPKPTLKWLFRAKNSNENHDLTTKSKYQISGEKLIVNNLSLADSGNYTCIATSVLGQDIKDIYIEIEEPPVITNADSKDLMEDDSIITIPCVATGFPVPKVTWKYNNIIINNTDRVYVSNDNALVILNPKVSDTNDYVCEATNKKGSTSKIFPVHVNNVIKDARFLGEIDKIYTLEGDLEMKCLIPGSNNGNTRWYKNGVPLNKFSNVIIIPKATSKDDGNYTCRVNLGKESISHTYNIDFGSKPTFNGKQDETVKWEDIDKLNCSVTSKPLAEVKWFHNGQELLDENSFEHTINDFGKYSCQVKNIHGTIERNFQVTSEGCLINKSKKHKNMPLIKKNEVSNQLHLPSGLIKIESDDSITLKCNTKQQPNNTFSNNEATIEAICLKEDKFKVNDSVYKFTDLKCQEELKASIIRTNKECFGEGTELINVIFDTDVEIYNSCHDKVNKRAIYTINNMDVDNNGNKESTDEWVKTEFGSFNMSKVCKDSKTCCYDKGQFVNVRDVDFGPPQKTTYFEGLNSVTIWKPCEDENRVSWIEIEEDIRNQLYDDLGFTVWSGASNYTHTDIGTLPRYLWKIIWGEDTAFSIIYVNNATPNEKDILCETPQWIKSYAMFANFENITKGKDRYTYICSVSDFLKVLNVTSVFLPNFDIPQY